MVAPVKPPVYTPAKFVPTTPVPTEVVTNSLIEGGTATCPFKVADEHDTFFTVAAGLDALQNPGSVTQDVVWTEYARQKPTEFKRIDALCIELMKYNGIGLPPGMKACQAQTRGNVPAGSTNYGAIFNIQPGQKIYLPPRMLALLQANGGTQGLAAAEAAVVQGNPALLPDAGAPPDASLTLTRDGEIEITPDGVPGAPDADAPPAVVDPGNADALANTTGGRSRRRGTEGGAPEGGRADATGGKDERAAKRTHASGGSGVHADRGAWLDRLFPGRNPANTKTPSPDASASHEVAHGGPVPEAPVHEPGAPLGDTSHQRTTTGTVGPKEPRAGLGGLFTRDPKPARTPRADRTAGAGEPEAGKVAAPKAPTRGEQRRADQAALDALVATHTGRDAPNHPVTKAAVLAVAQGRGTPAEKQERITKLVATLEAMAPSSGPPPQPGQTAQQYPLAIRAQGEPQARQEVIAALDEAGIPHDGEGNPRTHGQVELYPAYTALPSSLPGPGGGADSRVASRDARESREPRTPRTRTDEPRETRTARSGRPDKPGLGEPEATDVDMAPSARPVRTRSLGNSTTVAQMHAEDPTGHLAINSWEGFQAWIDNLPLSGRPGFPTTINVNLLQEFKDQKEVEGMPPSEAAEIAYHAILGTGVLEVPIADTLRANKGNTNAPEVQQAVAELEKALGFNSTLTPDAPPTPDAVAATNTRAAERAERVAARDVRTATRTQYRESMAQVRENEKAAHTLHKKQMEQYETQLKQARDRGDTTAMTQIQGQMVAATTQYQAQLAALGTGTGEPEAAKVPKE